MLGKVELSSSSPISTQGADRAPRKKVSNQSHSTLTSSNKECCVISCFSWIKQGIAAVWNFIANLFRTIFCCSKQEKQKPLNLKAYQYQLEQEAMMHFSEKIEYCDLPLVIPEFKHILSHVFAARGACPDKQGLEKLKEYGFLNLIDLSENDEERTRVEALGLRYQGFQLDPFDPDPKTVMEFLQFISNSKTLFNHQEGIFIYYSKGDELPKVACYLISLLFEQHPRPTKEKIMQDLINDPDIDPDRYKKFIGYVNDFELDDQAANRLYNLD